MASGEAERSRLEGRADPDRWAEAARRWDGLGFPAPAGYCRWRQAAAELSAGRRAQALPLWRAAWQGAADLGADGLREAIETDAARAAVPLAGEGEAVADAAAVPFGLTARELEVLDLVAAGRTNRQIGERLFISEKTASVHVSRILAKLGARSRAQAAAMAGTVGLVGSTPANPTPRSDPPVSGRAPAARSRHRHAGEPRPQGGAAPCVQESPHGRRRLAVLTPPRSPPVAGDQRDGPARAALRPLVRAHPRRDHHTGSGDTGAGDDLRLWRSAHRSDPTAAPGRLRGRRGPTFDHRLAAIAPPAR